MPPLSAQQKLHRRVESVKIEQVRKGGLPPLSAQQKLHRRVESVKTEQVRKGGLPPLLCEGVFSCTLQLQVELTHGAFLMTKKWSNQNLPGALHFLTGNVLHRIPIFRQEARCKVFLEVCADLLRKWPCKLISFVVMPDHFHMIVNPRDGDIRRFAGALKSLAAGRIIDISDDRRLQRKRPDKDGSVHQVWQESFKALPLWSLWMIWQKINYIHANPVKARLVISVKDYPWSSFRAFYFNSNEPLAVDHDWWWPDDEEKLSKAIRELAAGASHPS